MEPEWQACLQASRRLLAGPIDNNGFTRVKTTEPAEDPFDTGRARATTSRTEETVPDTLELLPTAGVGERSDGGRVSRRRGAGREIGKEAWPRLLVGIEEPGQGRQSERRESGYLMGRNSGLVAS